MTNAIAVSSRVATINGWWIYTDTDTHTHTHTYTYIQC